MNYAHPDGGGLHGCPESWRKMLLNIKKIIKNEFCHLNFVC